MKRKTCCQVSDRRSRSCHQHPTRVAKTSARSPMSICYQIIRISQANALRKRSGKSKTDSPVRPESASANEPVNTTTHKLCVYALTPENASVNEVVRPCVLSTRKQADEGSAPSSSKTESPVRPESASANEGVHPCVLSIKKAGDEGSAPSSAIEEKQESWGGQARPGRLGRVRPTRPFGSGNSRERSPSAQQLRREELEYTASYGDTDCSHHSTQRR